MWGCALSSDTVKMAVSMSSKQAWFRGSRVVVKGNCESIECIKKMDNFNTNYGLSKIATKSSEIKNKMQEGRDWYQHTHTHTHTGGLAYLCIVSP